MSLFNRIVSVTIGKPGAQAVVDVQELRVKFTAKKTSEPNANTCIVDIYNLNSTQRSLIKEIDDIFILQAGYSGDSGLETLFIGDVVKVAHKHDGTEWVSTVQFNDGQRALTDSKTALSFKAGASTKDCLQKIADSFGIPVDTTDIADKLDGQFANGYSDIGSSAQAMDTVAERVGVEWSIQNGTLVVRKQGTADNVIEAVLSPEAGLVGSPTRIEAPKAAKDQPRDPRPRWEFTTLLMPSILPGNKVFVQNVKDFTNGDFRVEAITHTGDTHGAEWTSTIEAIAL